MSWQPAKKKALSIGILLTLCTAVYVKGVKGSNPEEEVIAEIENGYRIVFSVSGSFEQAMPLEGMGITREARGVFYVQKPGKSRWEYAEPVRQVFIVNGENLFFKKETDDNFRQTRIDSQMVGIFNLLLGGEGNLNELFKYSRVKIDGKGLAEVELVPQGELMREIKRVVLTWNRKSKIIAELTIVYLTGSTNTLSFHDVKVNQRIPSSLFITQ